MPTLDQIEAEIQACAQRRQIEWLQRGNKIKAHALRYSPAASLGPDWPYIKTCQDLSRTLKALEATRRVILAKLNEGLYAI